MADFNVAIRSSYRDVARLCLDLRPGDWELSPERLVTKWRNSAPPAWNGSFRFSDAKIINNRERPSVSGDRVRFSAARQTGLRVTNTSASSQEWTLAWEFFPGARTTKQAIAYGTFTFVDFRLWRIGTDGVNHGYRTDAGDVISTEGEMAEGAYMMAFDGAGAAQILRDNVVVNSGVADDVMFRNSSYGSETSSLLLGHSIGGDFLDGDLRSFRIWNRVLSAKERDFVFKTMGLTDSAGGVAPDPRASMEIRSWVDGTGDLSLRQARRVNPSSGRHQKFRCAVSGSAAIVQIACETAGDVLADTGLGGDLYTMTCIERASVTEPTVTQDSGWSSIFDIRIPTSGHYTFLLARANHGAVYVHFDAEIG